MSNSPLFFGDVGGCCCGCWNASNDFDGLRNTDWHYANQTITMNIGDEESSIEWIDTDNARNTDGTYSTITLGENEVSQYLMLYDYGFEFPTGATIYGGEVRVMHKKNNGTIVDDKIYLHWKDDVVFTSSDHADIDSKWKSTRKASLYGDVQDAWDISSGDINDENFGVCIRVKGDAKDVDSIGAIDSVAIRIWYVGCGQLYEAWDVCSGDWTMEDLDSHPTVYNCAMVANTKGMIVWKRSPDGDTPRVGTISVDIKPNPGATYLEDGANYRIYALSDADCEFSQWIAADLQIKSEGGVLLGKTCLINSSNDLVTSNTEWVSVIDGTTLSLCLGLHSAAAWISSSTYQVRTCHEEEYNDRLYFALGNESSIIKATFDNVSQLDHYDNDVQCQPCLCSCEKICMPIDLCLTLHDDPEYGGCDNIDGVEMDLDLSSTPCSWITDDWICPNSVPYRNNGYFTLNPGDIGHVGASTDDFVLYLIRDGITTHSLIPNENSTCDPLYLEYDDTTLDDVFNLRCCDGELLDAPANMCQNGSEPQKPGASPLDRPWFCKGHFFITITERAQNETV